MKREQMRRFILPVGVGVLGLAAGYGIGMANTETVEKVVEVERMVEVTPPACIEALDLGSEALDITAQFGDMMATLMGTMAEGANSGDVGVFISAATAGMETVSQGVPPLTAEIEALTGPLGVAANECRAGA